MSELLPCFSCGGPVDWCRCDGNGCHRIRCETCQYELDCFSADENDIPEGEWTERKRAMALIVWNRRSTPIDSSPSYSSTIGADPAIEVGGTFNRRLDAVRVEDYEKAIAGIKWLPSGYCTPDYIGDFLIGRARAIARQRGESNGRS